MCKTMMVVAALIALLILATGPAMATGVDLPLDEMGAGLAGVFPWDSDAESFGAFNVTLGLPIQPPEHVLLSEPLTLAQWLAAEGGLNVLVHGLHSDKVAFGASLAMPVYNSTGKMPVRAGVAYVGGTGGAWFLAWDLSTSVVYPPPAGSELVGRAPPIDHLTVSLMPGGAVATYTALF